MQRSKISITPFDAKEMARESETNTIRKIDSIDGLLEAVQENDFVMFYGRRSDCDPCIEFDPFIFRIGFNMNLSFGEGTDAVLVFSNFDEEERKIKEFKEFIKDKYGIHHVPCVIGFIGEIAMFKTWEKSKKARKTIKKGMKHAMMIIDEKRMHDRG